MTMAPFARARSPSRVAKESSLHVRTLSRGNPFGWNSPAGWEAEKSRARNTEFRRDNDKWERSSLRFNINLGRAAAYYRPLVKF